MAVTHFSDLSGTIWTATITISRPLTDSITGLAAFQVPFDSRLIQVSAYSRRSSGASPGLSLIVRRGVPTLAEVVVAAGAISTAHPGCDLSEGDGLTFDALLSGPDPTWEDITLMLTFRRTN